MTNSHSDIQDLQRNRKVETEAKIIETLRIIEGEVNAHGVYPHNHGKLTLAEIARRAGIGESTLRNRHHLETKRHVKSWIRKIGSEAPIAKGCAKTATAKKVAFYEDALRKTNTEALLWREELQALKLENKQLREQLATMSIPSSNVVPMEKSKMADVKFKRVDGNDDLPLPFYATSGAAGMDLRAFLPDGPVVFRKGDLKLVSTGFCVELPQNVEMQIRPRSGMALKHRFTIPNSPGTIDEDYRGCVMVGLYYFGEEDFSISHGDRIAQAVFADVKRVFPLEVSKLSSTERGDGGFGSTGTK